VIVGLYWTFDLSVLAMELPMFARFLSGLASCAMLTVFFTVWWLTNRHIGRADRLLVLATAVLGGVAASVLSPAKVGVMAWLLLSLPVVFTAWTVWLAVARKASPLTRRNGLLAVLILSWGSFTLIRMEGLTGDAQPVIRWCWSPTAEELYLAERARSSGNQSEARQTSPSARAEKIRPEDWPGFRGPARDGVVRGMKIATDWAATPPQKIWRQRVGPAWSSVVVVGDRLYTQEQRGSSEAVVCLDAGNGREVWAHLDAVRFWDAQGGPGPRATPMFAGGRIYALGATGILNCLDAASGDCLWSHDVAVDFGAPLPMWGFASSPLVVKGVVIVFAGGDSERSLLAYDAASGRPVWAAAAGKASYSSPQPAANGAQDQVLFLGDRGLTAFDPATGKVLWEYGAPGSGMPRSLQPHPFGKDQVVIASEGDLGTELIEVMRDGTGWRTERRWASRQLKPSFNDFVVHGGFVYGFDGNTFCCLDGQTGERRWRDGRYGHGQVLLLADQGVMVLLSEDGAAVLVAADPGERKELGRFPAVTGKTWNHPVIAGGRLYVRNAEEMACYELKLQDSQHR
jgi:outer membrane protein assembly factor BamB